jgi:AcrR family transcriptional regulator
MSPFFSSAPQEIPMPRPIPFLKFESSRSAKNRVLRAAAKLFATNGFRGTSVRQIANRAKVNEVTVFRLFNSKRALYKEVLESKLKKTPLLEIPSEMNGQDEQILRVFAHGLQQVFDPEIIRLIFFAALESPEEMRRSVSPHMDRYYSLVAEYLQRQMNSGVIRKADPTVMAKALLALLVYDRISSDYQSTPAEATKAQTSSLLEIWLHGVAQPQLDVADVTL